MYKTKWRQINSREYMRVCYGFRQMGNQIPRLSITAEIAEPVSLSNRHGDWVQIKGKRYVIISFGCLHGEILNCFPELSPLIPYHLVSINGLSLNYEANALYWMQKHLGVYKLHPNSEPEARRYGEPEPLKAFLETVIFNSVPSDQYNLNQFLKSKDWKFFHRWLERRKPFLRKKMELVLNKFPEIEYKKETSKL